MKYLLISRTLQGLPVSCSATRGATFSSSAATDMGRPFEHGMGFKIAQSFLKPEGLGGPGGIGVVVYDHMQGKLRLAAVHP